MVTKNEAPQHTRANAKVSVEDGPGIKELLLLILEPSKSIPLHNPRTFTFTFGFYEGSGDKKQNIECFINAIPWGMSCREGQSRGLHLTAARATPLEKFKAELIKFEGEYNFNTRKGTGYLIFEKIDTD